MTYEILHKALKWFKVHNIDAFINNGKMYLRADDFEFQLTSEEVEYRAEEYIRLKKNELIK